MRISAFSVHVLGLLQEQGQWGIVAALLLDTFGVLEVGKCWELSSCFCLRLPGTAHCIDCIDCTDCVCLASVFVDLMHFGILTGKQLSGAAILLVSLRASSLCPLGLGLCEPNRLDYNRLHEYVYIYNMNILNIHYYNPVNTC
jgi:hypothetical protein